LSSSGLPPTELKTVARPTAAAAAISSIEVAA